MPVYGRQNLAGLWNCLQKGETAPVYFIFGDRYLGREIADELVSRLLPGSTNHPSSLTSIDGEQEEIGQTINMFRTFSLFGGRRILRVNDSRILYSRNVAATFWQKAAKAHASQDPGRARGYLRQTLALAGLLPADWAKEEIASWSPGRWQEAFGFARPEERAWVRDLLVEAEDSPSPTEEPKNDPAEQLLAALEVGAPAANILILVAEAADKRKKLFKYLEKHGVVIDLSVDTGSGSGARRDQEALLAEIIRKTLAGFGKKLEPRALAPFLERVGFQPAAAAMEAEKLALYAGDAETIRLDDLNAMVGRTREEALYELNEAFAGRDLARSLMVLHRLLENSIYPLVIVAGLRNLLRKLLLLRAIIDLPAARYSRGMAFPVFQKNFLPALKETLQPWPAQLNGHPFAVHKGFVQAEGFTPAVLRKALSELLEAEYRLKGSGLPAPIVLGQFLFSVLRTEEQ
jgi:DNA polymerase-3 subunit delta